MVGAGMRDGPAQRAPDEPFGGGARGVAAEDGAVDAAQVAALGRVAFEMIVAQLAGKRPRSRVLPVELEVRGSTAAPPPV